ncbi:hypothetical protein Y1Q_0024154 [Alligator mississippiensis]|uniref:Secreted protein n=1 Tax=Alligator mississippiensis TaxID=8496 RepID=A0A151NHV9_ALLMI|nr:hypothetical protein Y1Q_0024154 [Alligator mississippiensis]
MVLPALTVLCLLPEGTWVTSNTRSCITRGDSIQQSVSLRLILCPCHKVSSWSPVPESGNKDYQRGATISQISYEFLVVLLWEEHPLKAKSGLVGQT